MAEEIGEILNKSLESKNDQDIICDYLKSIGVPYTKIDHEPLFTMNRYGDIEKRIHSVVPKNLFLSNRQETKHYLLIIKGDKKFKTKELSSQISSARLSFGKEEKLKELLHCHIGSTSVFGLFFDKMHEVQLLIDEELLLHEYLAFHPCINTSTIRIKTDDLINTFLPSLNHSYQKVILKGEETPFN